MSFPDDIGIIDLMVTTPREGTPWHESFGNLVRDRGSEGLAHPGGYMFKDLPTVDGEADYIAVLLSEMDRWNIERALIPVAFGDRWGSRGVREHPDRLLGSVLADPGGGVEAVRNLRRASEELGCIAAACFPSGTSPQVGMADPSMYPLYAACVELDIPIFLNVGVPGPRFPMWTQDVAHLDPVCYDFPDLKVVMRHGGEPWEELAVKLMLKWPNLYYSTSAFAPKHYPKAIVDYANTRGAHKICYAGYFPSGLSLERIMTELPAVPFKPEVWPRFLRENAEHVLGLVG